MNLYQANSQWSTRPADERFWTLQDLHNACDHHRTTARQATVKMRDLAFRAGDDGNVLLAGPTGTEATLTHWSFGQIAGRISAPADYLRSLPAPLAAQNLNHGLQRLDADATGRALFHQNGSLVCRCVTSDQYTRIFNSEVTSRLLPLESAGWRVPPARPVHPNQPGARPATEADVLRDRDGGGGLSVNVGDMISPAGLYASDHDMFAFLVNEERIIQDGSEGGLARGFFVTNSEVGAAALKVTKFLYRHVCGNHIVWGAKAVSELRIVHRGAADRRFAYQLAAELKVYANQAASIEEARIVEAKSCILGDTKDEVLDRLFKGNVLPRKGLEKAYEYAEIEADTHAAGSPRTAWGFAQGITRLSQDTQFADKRNEIDRAAGRVLEMAF